jgi:hypothetical protein
MTDPLSFLAPISRLLPTDSGLDKYLPLDSETLAAIDKSVTYTDFHLLSVSGGVGFEATIAITGELSIPLPWLSGTALVFGGGAGAGLTSFRLAFAISKNGFTLSADDVEIALRLPPDVLKPAPSENGGDTPKYAEIAIKGGFTIDQSLNLQFHGFDKLSLSPVMIGDSGVVISADDVKLSLSPTQVIPEVQAAGFDEGFVGVFIGNARVRLPDGLPALAPEDLVLQNCVIGTGGVSGRLAASYSPTFDNNTQRYTGRGATELFGIPFALTDVEIEFRQNALKSSKIAGKLLLPFFDEYCDIEIGLNLDGSLAVKLSATGGIITLTKQGLLSVTVDSLAFALVSGVFTAKISGTIKPLAGDPINPIKWPSFAVRELSIDSQGHVRLTGGWIDLPKQYALDFHGFKLEITKLGFGKTEDGGKWIVFSGGLKLVDLLPAGASVEGLRFIWYDDTRQPPFAVTLNGVGLELEVPDVLKFKGAVSYSRKTEGGDTIDRFDGAIKLNLEALNLEIDSVLSVGSVSGADNYKFFAIYVGVELPAGIPLWSTGLALYGMAALFALDMQPNKGLPPRPADEEWYEGWYKKPQAGVTDLKSKWDPSPEALALGAGVTLGTLADNGYTFSGRVLLVIVFPGPILLIEGKANLLKDRAKLGDDPTFRALAVLDNRAGQFVFGLDALYKYDKKGELIDIRGGVQAFYDFHHADAWHVWLGQKDPREKRIRAHIFQLYEADAYLMADQHQLAMGALYGYNFHWNFGPLSVTLEAWLAGDAVVSRKPNHFYGDLWLHGKLAATVFGFGFNLEADATASADVFKPFHAKFDFHVKIGLPWPLKSFDVDASIEWPPDLRPPDLPLPLKEVAIEHFKVTTNWPLPRGDQNAVPPVPSLLLPNYDNGDGFLTNPSSATQPFPWCIIPVVPLDARPHLTFARPINDDALVGVNPQPVFPDSQPKGWEWIGDASHNVGPARVRYGLAEVTLEKYVTSPNPSWQSVATTNVPTSDPTRLFGSWAPIPQLPSGDVAAGTAPPVANIKLFLWSKSAFDYTVHSGGAWDEWFSNTFGNYPCVPPPPNQVVCCNFESYPIGTQLSSPWTCADHPEVSLSWTAPAVGTITALPENLNGLTRELCFPGTTVAGDGAVVPVVITATLPSGATGITFTVPNMGQARLPRLCVKFTGRPSDHGPNPRAEQGVTFLVRAQNGTLVPNTELVEGKGLDCGFDLEIALPCPSSSVDLSIFETGSPTTFDAFDHTGTLVDSKQLPLGLNGFQPVTLNAVEITRVVVRPSEPHVYLGEVCYVCSGAVSVNATDANGNPVGSTSSDGTITVSGASVSTVQLSSLGGLCISKVCVTLSPSTADVQQQQDLTAHMVSELARWSQTGEVLEPDTTYRLKVVTKLDEGIITNSFTQTEYAYFRTQGPPGLATLSRPIGAGANTNTGTDLKTGLEDLTVYVQQTVPPTVPWPGERPPLPRPVYRAYDVGVQFNEDYVDLLYRIDRRDLGLYLYNNNNRPVRDAQGRLVVLGNEWGKTEERTLTESEKRWLAQVNSSTCAKLDQTIFPPDRTLSNSNGQVLDADAVYEARLIPMLLHEAFSTDLTGWLPAVDDSNAGSGPSAWAAKNHPTLSGTAATVAGSTVTLDGSPDLSALDPTFDGIVLDADAAGSSHRYAITKVDNTSKTVTVDGTPSLTGSSSPWEIPSVGAVVQTSPIGGSPGASDSLKPGTVLLGGKTAWTDYRLSVLLRSSSGGAIGLVFRASDNTHYYVFSMDSELGYRGLVRVIASAHTVLAEDDFVYQSNLDYLITIEAVADSINIYQDGSLVFAVSDSAILAGQIGLYCAGNPGARFADVRVDDFSSTAPVVYRFKFTTSQFANFYHHLHSFQDETWLANADVSASAAKAVALSNIPPPETEARNFEQLANLVLGSAALQDPLQVEVTRVDREGQTEAFLVRSPEPVDWTRTSLSLSTVARTVAPPQTPKAAKLTAVTFANAVPNDETVDLLLREVIDLSGYGIERRSWPAGLNETPDNPVLLVDNFELEVGLLFRETFAPDAMSHYTIIDQEPPSVFSHNWAVANGRIEQTGNYIGGGSSLTEPYKPGTIAVTGLPQWANVRIRAKISSGIYDDIGIVFRYQGEDAYYRFSMSSLLNYRRLIKHIGAVTTMLWEDQVSYTVGKSYELTIYAFGDLLLGYLDDALLFNVRDADVPAGQVGFYSWRNTQAHFEGLEIYALDASPILWQPSFLDLSEVTIVDEGTYAGPSAWSVQSGVLVQSSSIRSTPSGNNKTGSGCLFPFLPPVTDLLYAGTYALGGNTNWEDVHVTVRLRSDSNGAIGVMFRYRDPNNYYRFSMDALNSYRRLIRNVGGNVVTLWEDSASYSQGVSQQIEIRAVGNQVQVGVDGTALFTVYDRAITSGRVGLYSANNPAARFESVLVADDTRWVSRWTIHDDGGTNAPSVWRISSGALFQETAIGGEAAPVAPGTLAIGGDANWSDYRVMIRFRSDDPHAVGVLIRYQDPDNYYRLSLDQNLGQHLLVKCEKGTISQLWSQPAGYSTRLPLELTVDAVGDQISAYLANNQLFAVSDATHKTGRVGFYTWSNPKAQFRHIEVRRPPLDLQALFRDRFVLGDTSGWRRVDEGTFGGPSNWATADGALRQTSSIFTPPIDSLTIGKQGTQEVAGDVNWTDLIFRARLASPTGDTIGVVFRYADASNYYRFSMDKNQPYRRLVKKFRGTFSTLWQDSEPYDAGQCYELTIVAVGRTLRGFVNGVPLFVVQDGDVQAGQIGLYCWHNMDARFSAVRVYPASLAFQNWLLDESFNTAGAPGWSFVDDGSQAGPSVWTVTNGVLEQTSGIYGGSILPSDPEKPGTYGIVGDAAWQDYRLVVRLISTDPDAVGAMVRYVDGDNYYRFSMDRNGSYRRFVKKSAGVVTTLWEDSQQFIAGREYVLTIDCVGPWFRGYLDAVEMFSVVDFAQLSGRVGLYCWKNPGAQFLEVRVAEPQWVDHYTFADEAPLPAGSHVRVYSGNASDTPPDGIKARYVASLDDSGVVSLGPNTAELHIRTPGTTAGHARVFLDASEYEPVTVKVLRKADGTGFVIFPAAGSTLAPGEYRLQIEYLRDNRAADSQSIVLRQAGNSDPETVTIDVPGVTNSTV